MKFTFALVVLALSTQVSRVVADGCNCDSSDGDCLTECVNTTNSCIDGCNGEVACYTSCIQDKWPGQTVPSITSAASAAATSAASSAVNSAISSEADPSASAASSASSAAAESVTSAISSISEASATAVSSIQGAQSSGVVSVASSASEALSSVNAAATSAATATTNGEGESAGVRVLPALGLTAVSVAIAAAFF
ncbi:hypothetical protein CLU79DRAFT_744467 [Phycomyces nitens]|nr:hypothetical protein CLU79DRAFT_744467 [Phycomyces nitens]